MVGLEDSTHPMLVLTVGDGLEGRMSNYRRYRVAGGTYFFTLVTHQRRPVFSDELARKCLRDAIHTEQAKRPFELFAIVLLPEHLHCVWTLPPGDDKYSLRWAKIKEEFTRSYLKAGGDEGESSASRQKHRERAVWARWPCLTHQRR